RDHKARRCAGRRGAAPPPPGRPPPPPPPPPPLAVGRSDRRGVPPDHDHHRTHLTRDPPARHRPETSEPATGASSRKPTCPPTDQPASPTPRSITTDIQAHMN